MTQELHQAQRPVASGNRWYRHLANAALVAGSALTAPRIASADINVWDAGPAGAEGVTARAVPSVHQPNPSSTEWAKTMVYFNLQTGVSYAGPVYDRYASQYSPTSPGPSSDPVTGIPYRGNPNNGTAFLPHGEMQFGSRNASVTFVGLVSIAPLNVPAFANQIMARQRPSGAGSGTLLYPLQLEEGTVIGPGGPFYSKAARSGTSGVQVQTFISATSQLSYPESDLWTPGDRGYIGLRVAGERHAG